MTAGPVAGPVGRSVEELGQGAADASHGPSATSAGPRRVRGPALVLCVAAAVFLAVSATRWWQADHDASLALAQSRDAALVDGRRDVEVLTSLDHRHVDAGLARWLAASTGPLHDQLAAVDDTARQALEDAGKVSTGTVLEAALTRLDPHAGTASGIATVEISVVDRTGRTTVKRDRFSIDLELSHGTWLLSRLEQVPVGVS